ncbi:hypothetical protein EAG_07089 [Camponotus floridanus]|uniref:Uncharacterized protein n=1 Tax=Camponotus floridanus TaxID=104421 RepID=E2AJR1_CAMFO|nr:hypothetical protein EAG_07089 [Camponotus floridanus]
MNPPCGGPILEEHHPEQPLWRENAFGASKGGNCSNRPHWGKGSPCGDGKWPMASWRSQIRRRCFNNATVTVTTDYVVSDSCLFSLETIERAMRGELNNTQRTLYISSSFVPRYEIFKEKIQQENNQMNAGQRVSVEALDKIYFFSTSVHYATWKDHRCDLSAAVTLPTMQPPPPKPPPPSSRPHIAPREGRVGGCAAARVDLPETLPAFFLLSGDPLSNILEDTKLLPRPTKLADIRKDFVPSFCLVRPQSFSKHHNPDQLATIS